MSRDKHETLKGAIKGDTARRERLAAELRENLKRRKAQARAIEQGGGSTEATETDGSGRRD